MLYEEWEKNDEEKIPEDELPYGHPDRPYQKSFKLEDINPNDPESIKRASKLNKNVIVVATLSDNPTRYKKGNKSKESNIGRMFLGKKQKKYPGFGRWDFTTIILASTDSSWMMTGSCFQLW